jgi:hypothetical protein
MDCGERQNASARAGARLATTDHEHRGAFGKSTFRVHYILTVLLASDDFVAVVLVGISTVAAGSYFILKVSEALARLDGIWTGIIAGAALHIR